MTTDHWVLDSYANTPGPLCCIRNAHTHRQKHTATHKHACAITQNTSDSV